MTHIACKIWLDVFGLGASRKEFVNLCTFVSVGCLGSSCVITCVMPFMSSKAHHKKTELFDEFVVMNTEV
jgi:hypothetical protein